jgi:hypothetical protein
LDDGVSFWVGPSGFKVKEYELRVPVFHAGIVSRTRSVLNFLSVGAKADRMGSTCPGEVRITLGLPSVAADGKPRGSKGIQTCRHRSMEVK